MTIIGIDPGLRTTGYGVIEITGRRIRLVEAGIVRPRASKALAERLRELFEGLGGVLTRTRPSLMAIEDVWVGDRDPSAALVIGHARGVLCLAAAMERIDVMPIAHTTVKRALTGSGAATKLQVKQMVVSLLSLKVMPEPDDVSDALAVAIAQANLSAAGRLASA